MISYVNVRWSSESASVMIKFLCFPMFLSDLWPHSGCPGSLQQLPTQWFSSFPGWLSFRAQQWELLMFRHVPWTKVLKPIRKRWRILQTRRIGTTGRTRSNWKVWSLMITCDYSWLDSIIFFDVCERVPLYSTYCCRDSSKTPLPFNPCLSAFVCSTLQASISKGGTTKAPSTK